MHISIMRKLTALLITGILLTGFLPTGSAVKAEIYGGDIQMAFSASDLQYFAFIDKKNASYVHFGSLSPDNGPAWDERGNRYLLSQSINKNEFNDIGLVMEYNTTNVFTLKVEVEWYSVSEWTDGSLFSMVGLGNEVNQTLGTGSETFYWYGNDTILNNNWISGDADFETDCPNWSSRINSQFLETDYRFKEHCFEYSFYEFFPWGENEEDSGFYTGFDGDCVNPDEYERCVRYNLTVTADVWSIREEPTLEANGGISQKYTYCDNTVELFMVSSDGDTVTVSPQGTWSPVLALLKDIEFSLDENDDYRYKY